MKMKIYITVLLLLQFQGDIQKFVSAAGTIEDLTRLKEKLFSNYDKEIRPVYNLSDAVNVDMQLFLLSILDFDEVSGSILLSLGVTMMWHDFRLSWNESDYGGINNMILNATKVWKPKAYLVSSADNLEQFGSDEFEVRAMSNGICYSSPGKLVKSTCRVDMTNFPTDSQNCSLLILPWSYGIEELAFSYRNDKIIMDYFNQNGEWDVTDTSVAHYYGFGPDSNTLAFTLHMRRKSSYFIISMTIPAYILCFLNPFVFLLPASSGERISYTITMFLSLAVYMTLIGDNMPKVSEPMAGISYFLLVSMLFSCLLIVLTIFTLRFHDLYSFDSFPKWLIRIVKKINNKKKKVKVKVKPQLSVDVVSVNGLSDMKVEPTEDTEATSQEIQKIDILNFIDKFLFFFTHSIIIAVIIGFTVFYYRFV